MIISASRRTDIPTYYSDWFFNRLKAGSVCVRNPMRFHQVSSVSLSPDVVDGFVFWTKNPIPMMKRLDELGDIPYYFQFTLNAYQKEVEPGLPDKMGVLVPAFQALSRRLGPHRVIWRYDPILLSPQYPVSRHVESFHALAERLSGYTERCVFSFVDPYRGIKRDMAQLRAVPPKLPQMAELAERLAEIAARRRIALESCAEQIDLTRWGIPHGRCIDGALFERMTGYRLPLPKDPNQRPACGCAASVDIGMYDSCPGGCRYCYANAGRETAARNRRTHDPGSPLLLGTLTAGDVIRERKGRPCRDPQTSLF